MVGPVCEWQATSSGAYFFSGNCLSFDLNFVSVTFKYESIHCLAVTCHEGTDSAMCFTRKYWFIGQDAKLSALDGRVVRSTPVSWSVDL